MAKRIVGALIRVNFSAALRGLSSGVASPHIRDGIEEDPLFTAQWDAHDRCGANMMGPGDDHGIERSGARDQEGDEG